MSYNLPSCVIMAILHLLLALLRAMKNSGDLEKSEERDGGSLETNKWPYCFPDSPCFSFVLARPLFRSSPVTESQAQATL